MRLIQLSAVALLAELAHGYLDTSPFFMFSTSEYAPPKHSAWCSLLIVHRLLTSTNKIQSADSVVADISKSLSQCPSDFYVLVSQPGVTANDYKQRKSAPSLAQKLSSKPSSTIRSSLSIPEVLGEIDSTLWEEVLEAQCHVQTTEIDASTGTIPAAYDMIPRLVNVYFPAPSKNNRAEDLAQNDAFLASILDMLPSSKYTVLYTTTSRRSSRQVPLTEISKEYEMDSEIQDSLHMDLKRDLGSHEISKRDNITLVDGPLFDRYQFFTPGKSRSSFPRISLLTEFF